MLTILFAGPERDWPAYEAPLRKAFAEAGLDVSLSPRTAAPETVDYIIHAPSGSIADFRPFTRAKAVLSLWAGVERIAHNPTLTQPLVRMVDPEGLTQGMVEWVTGHVLRHHLGMDSHIGDRSGQWRPEHPPLAPDRPVGLLGLGVLGRACAGALRRLGFPVTGWSRTPKTLPGIVCHHGPETLDTVLAEAQILVLLLPLTPATDTLLDAARLARMPEGAVVLNPGRGALIDDNALLAALDSGHLAHATLDVFRTEPLPADHPFWAHPRVTVTPHIASTTRPLTAARRIAEVVRLHQHGEPLPNLVDLGQGY